MIKKYFFILLQLSLSLCMSAHNNDGIRQEKKCVSDYFYIPLLSKVYKNVDEIAIYGNGNQDFIKYINTNVKNINIGVQASIRLKFIVTKHGKLKRVRIIGKKKRNYTTFEKEVVFILQKMPDWTPAKCNGKVVAYETGIVYRW